MTLFTFPALGTQGNRFQTIEALQAEVRRAIAAAFAEIGEDIKLVGEWAASSGAFPTSPTPIAGSTWIVTDAGTVDGVAFIAGDKLSALGAGGETYVGNWLRIPRADLPEPLPQSSGGTGVATLGSAAVTVTGGTAARTLANKLGERLSVADRSSLADAVTTGRRLLLAEGVHTIAGNIDSSFEPMRLYADSPEAILRRAATGGSGVVNVLDGAAGSRFERLTIDLVQDADAQTLVVLASASDQAIREAVINGGVTWSSGVRSGGAVSLLIPSGAVSGLTVEGSTLDGLAFLLLQSNTNTAIVERVRYLLNHFETYAGVVGLFNAPAPGAENRDLLVAFNSVGAAADLAIGSQGHWGSFAGNIYGGRVIGNYKNGIGTFFRAEENAQDCVFIGNTIKVGEEHGMEFIGNNAGGTKYVPRGFVVIGNALTGVLGTDGRSRAAITASPTAQDVPGLRQSVVAHNTMSTFSRGVQTNLRGDLVIMKDNISLGCEAGLVTREPSVSMSHMSIDDNIALRLRNGGFIDRLHYRQQAGRNITPDALVDVDSATSPPCGFRKLDLNVINKYNAVINGSHTETIANGDTGWNLFPLPSVYMRGRVYVFFGVDSADYVVLIADLKWNGTTLTYTEIDRLEAGDLEISGGTGLINTSGKLQLLMRNNSGGNLTVSRVQVDFDGLYLEGAA